MQLQESKGILRPQLEALMVLKTTNKMWLEGEWWKPWMELTLVWMKETSNLLWSTELGGACRRILTMSFGWEFLREIIPSNNQLQFGPICSRERTSKILLLLDPTHLQELPVSPKQLTKSNQFQVITAILTSNKKLQGLSIEKPRELISILTTHTFRIKSPQQTWQIWEKE